MRPRVKICGLTRAEDVEAVLAAGADYVGLNFYPSSARYVEPRTAALLREQVGDQAAVVGVFVNAPLATVAEIDREVGLDLLQFHGDEGPGDLVPFAGRSIKVFRVSRRFDPAELAAYETAWGFLFDNGSQGEFGGTGVPWAYETVAGLETSKPVFVAGGVGPENVAEVCVRCRPWGVDVCSAVESEPGRKDPALLQRLIEEIRHVEGARTT